MSLTSVELNPGTGGASIGVDDIGGVKYEVVKVAYGPEGSATMVEPATPLPVRAINTQKPSYGAPIALAVTALQSMASSATVGWKSTRINNLVALANDYEVGMTLTTANTAPANDKAIYVFVIPWWSSDGGTTWYAASGGTATLPTSADSTYTIAVPHNFILGIPLAYTTQNQTVQGSFLLSTIFGARMPDGFSIFIENFSGAALGTGCIVSVTPINDVLV
jgi:hypothetical protein